MLHSSQLEFSFSGLKTAVLYEVNGRPGSTRPAPELTERRRADVAAGFQEAVVDVLVAKCRQALETRDRDVLLVGGGVAANHRLRQKLHAAVDSIGVAVHFAPAEYCTDNAAMAAIAWEALEQGQVGSLEMDVTPGLIRMKSNL